MIILQYIEKTLSFEDDHSINSLGNSCWRHWWDGWSIIWHKNGLILLTLEKESYKKLIF